MAKISVDPILVQNVMRKITKTAEDIRSDIEMVRSAIANAEINGWNDKNHKKTKESFSQAEKRIKEGLNIIEGTVIPELKRLLKILETI